MGDHNRRFQRKKKETQPQNDTTSSSSQESSSRGHHDFTHRPPGIGETPSPRLTQLRRQFHPVAETRSSSNSLQQQHAQENKRQKKNHIPDPSTNDPHHRRQAWIEFDPKGITVHPSRPAREKGSLTKRIDFERLKDPSSKKPPEKKKAGSFGESTSQTASQEAPMGPSLPFQPRDSLSAPQEILHPISFSDLLASQTLSHTDRQFLQQSPLYPVRDLNTGTISEVRIAAGNPLDPYAFEDLLDPKEDTPLSFTQTPNDPRYTQQPGRYVLLSQHEASGDALRLCSPQEALEHFRNKNQHTQQIFHTHQASSQIATLDLSFPKELQDIHTQQQAEYELLQDTHHPSPSFTQLLEENSLLRTLNAFQNDNTHLQPLDTFDALDTQPIERDRTHDRPSGPGLPPLEYESYYHHLIPTNGDRNQCAIEAITIARGSLPQNPLFDETVDAIEQELQQEQIRDLGEMINFGDEDGTATMAYLRSTNFLNDNRPIVVYSRHPQSGLLRQTRIGDGPAVPYYVFYQHEALHYWGLSGPLENPFASDTQSSTRLTSKIARLGIASESAKPYTSSESQHKEDALLLATAQGTVSVSRNNPYDVSITDLEHVANALPLGWTNPETSTIKQRKKTASSSITNPFTDQTHLKKQPNNQRKQQNQFPSTQETTPRANDSQRTESGKRREKHPFSEGSTNPEVIQQLTERFIDTATNHTKIQGLILTNEQYEEVKDMLLVLKENEFISKAIREKAVQAAYKRSDKGKAVQAAYRQSDGGKAVRTTANTKYRQSDKGKAARAAYHRSSRGKTVRTARNERNSLLKNPEGRKQLVKERFLYEQGYLETPEYTQHQYYDTFWGKNQHKLIEEEKELLGTDEAKQKIIDEFIENSKDESEQESE